MENEMLSVEMQNKRQELGNEKLSLVMEIVKEELAKPDVERNYSLINESSYVLFKLKYLEKLKGMEERGDETQSLEPILAKGCVEYEKFLHRQQARNKRKNAAAMLKAQATVLCITISLCVALQVVCLAFGYDFYADVTTWGKTVLHIPADTSVEQDGITVVKHGESTTYGCLHDALTAIDEPMLYPTWLPDGVAIEKILYVEEEGIQNLWYTFSNTSYKISFRVKLNHTEDLVGNTYAEAERTYHVSSVGDSLLVNFIDFNNTYAISCQEKDFLYKIVEGLEYYK